MHHIESIKQAKSVLRELWRSGKSIGSMHSLGALHDGHGAVLRASAAENDCTICTIYPNKAQLAPSSRYSYNLEEDVKFAFSCGATHVISSCDEEMYPPDYKTFFDQGPCYSRLDATVVPYLYRGMITQSTRWIIFTRPTRSYWGMKDIAQTILVKRAVCDLMIDTEIREVPCVRYSNGIPVSSRLMNLPPAKIAEVARIFPALEEARKMVGAGERNSATVIEAVKALIVGKGLEYFRIHYVKIADPLDFSEPSTITLPFILHCAVTDGTINHFDGHYIRSQGELEEGVPICWVQSKDPKFS